MQKPDGWNWNQGLREIQSPYANRHKPEEFAAKRTDQYRRLYELVAQLALQDSFQGALTEILAASMSLVGADAGYIRLFGRDDVDPLQSSYPFVAHQGISDAYIKYFSSIPRPVDSNSRQANYEGRRVIIEDMTTAPPFQPHLDVVLAERYVSLQATPIMSASATNSLGTICTYFLRAYTPPEETFETLDLYAELAASAIERHQRIAELELRELELTAIVGNQRSQLESLGTQLRRAGQRAFALEPQDVRRLTNSLAEAIERSLDHTAPPQIKDDQLPQNEASNIPYGLSARELEVLNHLWQGLVDKQIALSIGISRFTVHKHVRSILQKMNVEGRTQAGIRAERERLFRFMPQAPRRDSTA